MVKQKNNITTSSIMRDYDIVITSYGVLVQEYPKLTKVIHPVSLKTTERKRRTGTLFNMHWKRVILDEAQAIKNRQSESHKAACAINATHRWAATCNLCPSMWLCVSS